MPELPTPRHRPRRRKTPPPPPGVPAELLAYARRPGGLRPGNRIEILRGGGEIFPSMLAAIAAARRYVHFEIYILRSDRTGRRFGDALAERARAGTTVRLLYDAVGSLGIDGAFLAELRRAGVEVVEFHPVAPWRKRFGLGWVGRRDHRKVLVVDGEVAFTGGVNVGDEYEALEAGGGGWHDIHARAEGPIVADFARLFRKGWIYAGGRPFPEEDDPPAAPPGTALATLIDNKVIRSRMGIRRAYLHAIHRARRSISIMSAYFLPDRGIRAALRHAAARGVAVQIIVPACSDIPAVAWAGRHLYDRLLEGGIRVFEWPERMMHAKTAVIDGAWSTIGSYNLDSRSLHYNLEVVLAILDPDFGARMQAHFDEEAARCREVLLDAWRERPSWQRLVEWAFFQLRRWL